MEIKYGLNPKDMKLYSTQEIKEEVTFKNFFIPDEIKYLYTHVDRALMGAIVPKTKELCLDDFINAKQDLGCEYPLAAREMGCINLGGDGYVLVDGNRYDIGNTTAIYIGKESKNVTFGSVNSENNAKFYFYSTPAHKQYPTKVITKEDAVRLELGSTLDCNERVILQYIQPATCDSCQVLLGYTQLAPGSVWNSMPTHVHERRTETYMYFNMKETDRVIHLMGEPDNTKHLIIENEELVISPAWSIHAGVGSGSYGFIWGMAGENRDLGDAVSYKISDLS
ncbi:MAG: 5-dehydro-4-deoxy-D-glucuronate isomerase [Epulopiscium sp. Nuni2H_MBin001]|nr:MAG: 5-dehydro-4-deoxy-D-glucuronate isomerase [Epulopiscium sp. Nuni2H_MBin001]